MVYPTRAGLLQCPWCSFDFVGTVWGLQLMLTHTLKFHNQRCQAQCTICTDFDSVFQLGSHCQEHLEEEHGLIQPDYGTWFQIVPAKKKIKCYRCSFEACAKHRINILVHRQHKHGIPVPESIKQGMPKCDQCGFVFKNNFLLKAHIKTTHLSKYSRMVYIQEMDEVKYRVVLP